MACVRAHTHTHINMRETHRHGLKGYIPFPFLPTYLAGSPWREFSPHKGRFPYLSSPPRRGARAAPRHIHPSLLCPEGLPSVSFNTMPPFEGEPCTSPLPSLRLKACVCIAALLILRHSHSAVPSLSLVPSPSELVSSFFPPPLFFPSVPPPLPLSWLQWAPAVTQADSILLPGNTPKRQQMPLAVETGRPRLLQ